MSKTTILAADQTYINIQMYLISLSHVGLGIGRYR